MCAYQQLAAEYDIEVILGIFDSDFEMLIQLGPYEYIENVTHEVSIDSGVNFINVTVKFVIAEETHLFVNVYKIIGKLYWCGIEAVISIYPTQSFLESDDGHAANDTAAIYTYIAAVSGGVLITAVVLTIVLAAICTYRRKSKCTTLRFSK